MKRLLILLIAVLILFIGCQENEIPDTTLSTGDESIQPVDPMSVYSDTDGIGNFEGSFLTMYQRNPEWSFPNVNIIKAYPELEAYFSKNEGYFTFGKRFILTCASYKDDFFTEKDIVMLVINEPSVYVSHKLSGISISDDGNAKIEIERSIPQEAPRSSDIIYHIIISIPKGLFDNLSSEQISVSVTEVISKEIDEVYDAERYRYIYPEFWPFTHSTQPLENASATISSIHTYEELLGFYEKYKTSFDLDKDFVRFIGSVYDEPMFNDYVLLIAVLPFNKTNPKPVVSDLFVYNLQIFLTIDNMVEEVPQDLTKWYLVAVAVDKKNLIGVNLNEFNIG